ncbi:MAG: ATP-grasp domain-containing protein [Clostridia bacterium]|nr:ATP-grasp domain-containing protein [Clostridia bacterium]
MRIGITYDLREDYGIDRNSQVFADFCSPDEIGYMADSIRAIGHEPVMIGNMYRLNRMILDHTFDCDMVLVCDEGIRSRNREAIVPALLELNRIPYIGSDAYCMGLSQNKYHCKLVSEALGIDCPKGIYLPYGHEVPEVTDPFPLVVKPNEEGYSMGVFLVHDRKELLDAVRYNYDNYHEGVLIEEYVRGKELYAPIVGTGEDAYVLGVGIARHADGSDFEIFTLNDKCFSVIRDEIPDLPEKARQDIERASLLLYRHMECRDFGRCDFKLTDEGRAVLIEINPRPGLTKGGPFENCAAAVGKTYNDIMGEIIESAVKRNAR